MDTSGKAKKQPLPNTPADSAASFSISADKASGMVVLSPGLEEGETLEIIDAVRRGSIKNGSSSKNRRSYLKGN